MGNVFFFFIRDLEVKISRGPDRQYQFDKRKVSKLMCKQVRNRESVSTHVKVLINFARGRTHEEWKASLKPWQKNTYCEDKEANPEWWIKSNQISLCFRICGLILCSRSKRRQQAFYLKRKCKGKLNHCITGTIFIFLKKHFSYRNGK